MGIASVVLGVLAAVSMVVGFFLSVVPVAGTVFTFLSPVLCLVGLVLGGMAMSEAKRDGMSTGVPTAGVVICGITFIPSVVVALTCGLCNACASATMLTEPPAFDVPTDPSAPGAVPPGAQGPAPAVDPLGAKPPLPTAPVLPDPAPAPSGGATPADVPEATRPEGAPPPAFPPPPLEAAEGARGEP